MFHLILGPTSHPYDYGYADSRKESLKSVPALQTPLPQQNFQTEAVSFSIISHPMGLWSLYFLIGLPFPFQAMMLPPWCKPLLLSEAFHLGIKNPPNSLSHLSPHSTPNEPNYDFGIYLMLQQVPSFIMNNLWILIYNSLNSLVTKLLALLEDNEFHVHFTSATHSLELGFQPEFQVLWP